MIHPANPRTRVFRATDPDDFGETVAPGSRSRVVLRDPGPFEATRWRYATEEMVIVRGRMNRAATFHSDVAERAVFSLAAGRGAIPRFQGEDFPEDTLAWWRPRTGIHTQWPAHRPWWNILIPLPRFQATALSLMGAAPVLPRGAVRFAPLSAPARATLVGVLRRSFSAPDTVPPAFLADGVIRALLAACWPDDPRADPPEPPSHARRAALVDGLVALADEEEVEIHSLAAVCERLGTPLRTLNAASNAVLGVSAGAYLRRRRLGRVHRDLERRAAASVTEAALRHGFWELGRFAGAYRAMFGETPSATRRRALA